MSEFTPTPRTQVRRLPDRGHYDSETVHRILDEGFLCHVGFVVDDQPFVIPTGYARVGDAVYLHGSAASRMLRTLAGGVQVCVTVTLVDGLVLARSAFHPSMNYRSVVKLSLQEVSAKVRVGPPKDEAEDYELPIWAGVLPLKLTAGAPIADPKLPEGLSVPEVLKNYSRSRA